MVDAVAQIVSDRTLKHKLQVDQTHFLDDKVVQINFCLVAVLLDRALVTDPNLAAAIHQKVARGEEHFNPETCGFAAAYIDVKQFY